MIQSAGEIAVRTGDANLQAWEDSVLLQLETLGTYWSAFVLRAPTTPAEGYPDVFSQLSDQMAFDRRISLVLDYPGSIVSERSEGLALILRRLLAHSKDAFALERGIHDHALARGVPEPVYRNVVSLLLPDVAHRHTDSVPRVVEANVSPESGPHAELAGLFTTLEAPALRRGRAAMLLDLLYADLDAANYSMIVRALVESVEQNAAGGDPQAVSARAGGIRRPAHRPRGPNLGAKRCPRKRPAALCERRGHRLAPAGNEPPSLLRAGDIIRLFGWLAEPGHKALLDLARRSFEAESRDAFQVLAEMDAPDFLHLRQLLAELPVPDLDAALRTLLQLAHPLLSQQIGALAVHANPQVRRTLLRAVAETQSRPGAGVVTRLLGDPLPDLRASTAAVLGNLRLPEAVPGLCWVLNRESDFGAGAHTKRAAAEALGQIGAPEGVSALSHLLFRGGLFARFAPTGRVSLPSRPCAAWERPRPAACSPTGAAAPIPRSAISAGWRSPASTPPSPWTSRRVNVSANPALQPDTRDQAACVDLLIELARAMKNISFYDSSHPVVAGVLAGLEAGLADYLTTRRDLAVSFVSGYFVVQDVPLVAPPVALGNLLGACLRRDVESIVFRRGVTREELERLVWALSANPELLGQEGGIGHVLEGPRRRAHRRRPHRLPHGERLAAPFTPPRSTCSAAPLRVLAPASRSTSPKCRTACATSWTTSSATAPCSTTSPLSRAWTNTPSCTPSTSACSPGSWVGRSASSASNWISSSSPRSCTTSARSSCPSKSSASPDPSTRPSSTL